MILYLGVVGVPESLIPLEFDTVEEARAFGEEIGRRYMETEDKLFIGFEISGEYEELDVVYTDGEKREDMEIDRHVFDQIADDYAKGVSDGKS